MRSLTALFAVIGVAGCATVALHEFDQRHGVPDPQRFDVPAAPVAGMSYRADVQPILERRCVVCHGCYDAPCQLKLGAWEGVARGSSQQPVYDAARLLEAQTTRLFVDAQLPSQWRQLGFSAGAERPDAERTEQPRGQRSLSLACAQARPSFTEFGAAVERI